MKSFKQHLISETINKEEFGGLFQKVINNEISASILYQRIANEMVGHEWEEFKSEMKAHSEEELKHFNILLNMASSRNIPYQINLTPDANLFVVNDATLVNRVQYLELAAIEDYKKLVEFSRYFMEFDMETIFKTILVEETEHYDDVADIYGGSRELA